ncbi:SIR2 family protein [Methylobacillus flagellatus]|uniref:SIR2 family protein n=1 Tax=Methylobacillus flagellatus TaxID=405 RepID=UPI002853FCF1|nr:SIR2 family protein [Methylobacillus flagellatus]MDR5170584.1 SIR2 family protein [Methylobacillus flagellatus]
MEFNADLIHDLAQRKVVLFLGAGVSASAITNTGVKFKQWKEFLLHGANLTENQEKIELINKLLNNNDYLFASELLKTWHGDEWNQILENEFKQLAQPSNLHHEIINLDQRIILTTNFDSLLEESWDKIFVGAKSKTHHPKVINVIDENSFKLFRDDKDYIIKIHGDVSNIPGIVFDTSSYHKNSYGNTYYTELLNSLLLTHTFLFIGFSMADPAIALIIEKYAHRFPASRPHYIFTTSEITNEEKDLWKKLRKLYIIKYSSENNHQELIDGLNNLNKSVIKRKSELIASTHLRTLIDHEAEAEQP